MKSLPVIFGVFLLVLCSPAAIIYDNTATFVGPELPVVSEIGDQIQFDGTERLITQFSFEYMIKNDDVGNPKARLRIYLNDGPIDPESSLRMPGTIIYESSLVSISGVGFPGYAAMTISGLKLLVPGDSITWAVEFVDIPPGAQYGLLRYHPPSVGSSDDFCWQKEQDGTWRRVAVPGQNYNFSARVEAIQAPNTNTPREQQIDLSSRFSFAGIELTTGTNTLAELLPNAPIGMVLYKFDNVNGYAAFQNYASGWSQPEATILPGEAFLAVMPPSAQDTNIFAAYQTTLAGISPESFPPVYNGWNLISAGRLGNAAGSGKIAAQSGDSVYFLNKQTSLYTLSTFNGASGKLGAAPQEQRRGRCLVLRGRRLACKSGRTLVVRSNSGLRKQQE
jgi:hypothetical protein